MFDYIQIDSFHLPKELKNDTIGWQTKCLDNTLSLFVIDRQGFLYDCDWYEEGERFTIRNFTGQLQIHNIIDDKFIVLSLIFKEGKLISLNKKNNHEEN